MHDSQVPANTNDTNFIKFLGTGGARFVVAEQLRASGGAWLSLDGTNIYLDPGPGALVKALASRPKLQPRRLDGILLSHRHIDHCNDINIMIEAMTHGGFDRRGVVFTTEDAVGDDPVVFRYAQNYPGEMRLFSEGATYEIGTVRFETPVQHIHADPTFGFNFYWKNHKISWVIDTKFFPELLQHYDGDLLILHCVRLKADPAKRIKHLNLDDVKQFLRNTRPKYVILTHFGRTMLNAKPWEVAQSLSDEFGIPVRAASDGWKLDLEEVLELE